MDLSVSHVVKSFDSAFCRRERAEKVNQSVEAFLYCILGAQVNVGSSILGDGGRAKEAQSQILTLLEDAIRQTAGQRRAAVPAGCRQGKGETLFGSDAWIVADALSHCD